MTTTSSSSSPTYKHCSACGESKPLFDFYFKNKATGRRQAQCKPCQLAYGKQHYRDNPDTYKAKAARHNASARERNQKIKTEALSARKCVCCESTEDLLFYDPQRGHGVQQAVHAALKADRVQQLIKKAQVWCRSCIGQHFKKYLDEWTELPSDFKTYVVKGREAGILPKPDRGAYRKYRRLSAPRPYYPSALELYKQSPSLGSAGGSAPH